MKKIIFTLSLIFFCVTSFAQSCFDSLSDIKNVKYVSVNKATISAVLDGEENVDLDETILNLKKVRNNEQMKSFISKIEGIYYASSENKKGAKKLSKAAKSILSRFSSVANFGDSDSRYAIYSGSENGMKVTVVYVQEKKETTLVSILGQTGLDDIIKMIMAAG